MNDLEHRVSRLERIEAAKVVAVEYLRACDAKDVGRLASDVFTPGIVLRVPGDEYEGTAAVSSFYQAAFDAAPGTRRHFLANLIAETTPDDEVGIDSYFLFLSAERDSVIGWGAYRDIITFDAGRAQIRDKTIVLDMSTTLDAGWATGAFGAVADA